MDFNNYDVKKSQKIKRSKLSIVMMIISVIMMLIFVAMLIFYISLKRSINEENVKQETGEMEALSEFEELKEFHYGTVTGTIEYTEVGSGLTLGKYIDDFVKREKNPNVTFWGNYSKSWIYLCMSGITDNEESTQTARIYIDSSGVYLAVAPLGEDKFVNGFRLTFEDQKKWNYIQTVGFIRVADGKTGEQVVDDLMSLFDSSVNAEGGHIANTTAGTPAFVFENGFDSNTDLGSFFKNMKTEIKAAVETTGDIGSRNFSLRVSGDVSFVIEVNETRDFLEKPKINYVDKSEYDALLDSRQVVAEPTTENLSKYGEDAGVED